MILALDGTIKNPVLKDNLQNLSGSDFMNKALPLVINLLIFGGVLAFIIYFLLGALHWITSRGDKGEVEKARDQITHGLIGLGVMLALFAIIRVVGLITGIRGLENLKLELPQL